MNIKFSYLYRDAANYKQHNEIVFANPIQKTIEEIQILISHNLIEGNWFVAKHWNVRDLHSKEYPWDPGTDHDWHEFGAVENTNDLPTEPITIQDFLIQISQF